MKAMVIERFGEPDVFIEKTLPRPALKPGHVLIDVHATSVNSVDVLIRRHGPPFLAPPFPAILHSDVAGIVVEVASDVTEFNPGDRVYGCAGGLPGMGGALAEFMLADASLIAHKPENASMSEAAALPLVTLTAWEALRERAIVMPGQKILVHGGAGGVGHIAVQLAKIAGAQVYATVSTQKKASIVKELGATETIDYRAMQVNDYVNQYTGGQGFDIVFDTVGNENLPRSFEAAKLNGNVVTTMSLGQYDLSLAHLRGLSVHVVFMLIPLLHNLNRSHHGAVLKEVAKLVDEGKLRPLIDPHRFTFNEVAAAHSLMESGKHAGKIVLTRE
ncbi:MAG TPA: zinc-dependent alcohol dehydrogenase family protein [Gallionella sp.]|nr:zinc-dependent alcohol dehydrogenase family protein [Gallionella sp.]